MQIKNWSPNLNLYFSGQYPDVFELFADVRARSYINSSVYFFNFEGNYL